MVESDLTSIPRLYRYLAPVYSPVRPIWARTIIRQAERYLERKALPESLSAEASILDLGCGPGINLTRICKLNLPFARYVGIDLSPAMLKRREPHDIATQNFLVSDAYHLPFNAGTFDLILSTWMFSHLLEPIWVVREAQRLLRPSGWLIVACFSQANSRARVLLHRIESLFLMRGISLEEIQTWPGLSEVKVFARGWNMIVCLRKDG